MHIYLRGHACMYVGMLTTGAQLVLSYPLILCMSTSRKQSEGLGECHQPRKAPPRLQQMQAPVAAAIEKPGSAIPDLARDNGSIGVLGFVTDRATIRATVTASNLLHENG